MAITTRIVAQQVTVLDGANTRVSKYPKFTVQLGYSVSSLAATELLDAASRAAASATAAKTSETNSKASETASKASQTAAKTSETNAKASEVATANMAAKAPLVSPLGVMTARSIAKVASIPTQTAQSSSVHLQFAVFGGGNGANRADNYAIDFISIALPGPTAIPTAANIDNFISHRVLGPRNSAGFTFGLKAVVSGTDTLFEVWMQSSSSFRDPKMVFFSGSTSVSKPSGPLVDGSAVAWSTTLDPDVIYATPFQVFDSGISDIDIKGTLTARAFVRAWGDIGDMNPTSQGSYLSWNKTKGAGRTDFVNHAGQGNGGFDWWNKKGTDSTLTALMSLTNVGELLLPGAGKGVTVTSTNADAGFSVNNVKFRSGESGNAAYIEANNANIRLRPSGTSVNQIEFTPQGSMLLPGSTGADTMISWAGGARLRSNNSGVMVISASNGSSKDQFITFRPQGDDVTASEVQLRANGNLRMTAANDTEPSSLTRRDSVINLINALASVGVNNQTALADLDVAEVAATTGVWKEGLNLFQTDSSTKNTPSAAGPGALGNGALATLLSMRQSSQRSAQILITATPNAPVMFIRALRQDASNNRSWTKVFTEYTKPNINSDINGITIDSNGFVKKASPIAKLTAELPSKENAFFWTGVSSVGGYVACNDEAEGVYAEKLGTGKYVVKGSLGWNSEGWKFEIPKDDNGNMLCFLESEWNEETKELTVSVFSRKFDLNTGNIIAGEPMEIPEARWIDLRLEMPYREPIEPEMPVDPIEPEVEEEIPETVIDTIP